MGVSAFVKKCGKSNRVEDQILSYVKENFDQPDLSVAKIAENLGMNPSYLSSKYGKVKGYGILETINRLRCAESTELLRLTDNKIEKISFLVGYTNVHSYIRVFKKYYKCTPTQYRQTYAEKNR